MRQVFALLFMSIMLQTNAQNYMLHAEYRSDWYGPGYPMTEDIPGFPSVTVQAQSEADQFVIESDNSYNKWRKYNETDLNVPAPFVFYAGLTITDNYLSDSTVMGHYYTTRLRNMGYASNDAVVMETSNMPVEFPNTLIQFPSGNIIGIGVPVAINATLSSTPSPQEKFYVRYSTDSWQTSAVLPMDVNLAITNYATATIPGQSAGTTLNYYVLSSTLDSADINHVNADLITLRRAVNGGQNYSYTVGNITTADSAWVVFRVDITNAPFNPVNGVFLAGSFNGYSTSANPMDLTTNNIYVDTVLLDTASTIQFKYVINDGGNQYELVPLSCGINDGSGNINRFLSVPEDSLSILPLVCFSECNSCMPQNILAVFTVNMSQQTVDPAGVYLAGDWNGFSATANPMTSIGNGLYTDTVLLMNGSTVQYKFVNGPQYENVPSQCGQVGGGGIINRSVTVSGDTVLAGVCFGECTDCIVPVLVPVVFQVNMSQQTINFNGVHLAGSFNGWSATDNLMINAGNGIYADTVMLDTTLTIEYKFLNGDSFANEEVVPFQCGTSNGLGGYNRTLQVPNTATTLNPVCFGQCTNCPQPSQVQVVFRVDMSQQNITGGVFLGGSFNGFNASLNQMTSLGNNIYADTVWVDTASTITYRFYNGSNGENVPAGCSVSGPGYNVRSLTTGYSPTLMPVVCFNYCSNCPPPVLVPVVFQVNMSLETLSPLGVHLAGSFNGWSPTANLMTPAGNGIFVDTVYLDTNSVIQYKFINGDSFATQENVPSSCGISNTVGGYDRELVVPNVPASLNPVCFGQCTNCVLPAPINVSFRVNLGSNNVSGAGVHVSGTFNNWNPASTPMVNVSANIWEATVAIDSTSVIQFKFVNGLNGQDYETVPAGCGVAGPGGFLNRSLVVPEQDTLLNTVCFNECSDCLTPVFVNVVFQVNMTQQSVAPSGVYLAGTFNGFSTIEPMSFQGNGIFMDTVILDTTQIVQYKFVNGQGSSAVYETVPSACGSLGGGGFINRQLDVPGVDLVLPVVCFNECNDCIAPVLVNVILTVDMSGQSVSPAGVHVSGTFNNWSATANPMSPLGNGLFTDTLWLDTTATIQYKFLNGNDFFGQESVPQACGVNDGFGGYNRWLSVPETDSSLSIVCFSSCAACVPLAIGETFVVEPTIWPNPSHGPFAIGNLESGTIIEVYSSLGQLLYSKKTNSSGVQPISIEHIEKGIYMIRLTKAEGTEVKRLPLIIQ